MSELAAFADDIRAPQLENWFQDDVPVAQWEGVTSNEQNQVSFSHTILVWTRFVELVNFS